MSRLGPTLFSFLRGDVGQSHLKPHSDKGFPMKIDSICPNCRKSFKVDEANLGRKGRCASCGTVFLVSSGDETSDGRHEFERAHEGLAGQTATVDSPPRSTFTAEDKIAASVAQDLISIRGLRLTFAQLLLIVVVFGAAVGTTSVFISSLMRPRTLMEQLISSQQMGLGANTGTPREFRGKKIPLGQAIVLGFLAEAVPVIGYEDEESFLVQEFDGSGRAKALKAGTIVELPPKLLVRTLEVIAGSKAELTYKGTFALRYKYKGDETDRNKLHYVEILEGPRKGQHWYVHEISLVQWDNVEEQQRHRDNSRREPGDLRFGYYIGDAGGQPFIYQTQPISRNAGF
jgi:predicted Zn finger-like uncharacterized protein